MGRRARLLEANYRAVREDVFKLCRALRFEPTWQQRQLLEIVQRRQPRARIAVKSGKGPGKSKVSGVIGLWWAMQGYGAKVVVTAPTKRQCKDVWLAELGRTLARADPWLKRWVEVTTEKVVLGGKRDWGVQTMTATNKEAALGFHEKKLKVIVEEASGVDREIVQALADTLSNRDSAMLQIGNPTTRDSAFFDCFNREKGRWHCLTFNSEETPASDWFDPERNRELEEQFGRDSDVYRIAVLGRFPHTDPSCVIGSEDVEAVTDRKLLLPAVKAVAVRQFGLDFARFGGDENTAYRRSGHAVVQWAKWPRTDPNVVVEKVFGWQRDCGWGDGDCWFVADAGGMGQGVMHNFHSAGKQVYEFHNGGRSTRPRRYANKITEAWFGLAARIKAALKGEDYCYLPADPLLVKQLSTRRYFVDKQGRIVLESKRDYEKRGHDSPDRADGCVLAFFDGVQSTSSIVGERGAA